MFKQIDYSDAETVLTKGHFRLNVTLGSINMTLILKISMTKTTDFH
jgi:hypothetical protein